MPPSKSGSATVYPSFIFDMMLSLVKFLRRVDTAWFVTLLSSFVSMADLICDHLASLILARKFRITSFLASFPLIFLNTAPPVLRHQVLKFGKLIFCRDEKSRIEFEARAEDECLDFSKALVRYDECLMKHALA